ncbi:hypothetical protein [Haloactinopolyspora alba]|uniref:hypothetical protein n=1 Tax=Haloactinopolyspora alba TaxID=648780 RepID=UPI0013EDE3B2|nr:hypothetical protein [Haloactinopolyspora alba]
MDQLLQRHLRENKLEPSTEWTYRGYLKKHVLPFIGLPAHRLTVRWDASRDGHT